MFGWLSTLPVFVADAFRRNPEHLRLLTAQSTWGELALGVARACIGMGEDPAQGNNRGRDIDLFRDGHGRPGQSWCAHFVSHCIRTAWAEMETKPCPLEHEGGARKLWKRAAKLGRIIDAHNIRPGDLLLWDRGIPGRPETRWQAHIGIAALVDAGRVTRYIAGNEGPVPALVQPHPMRWGRFVGAARLPMVGP